LQNRREINKNKKKCSLFPVESKLVSKENEKPLSKLTAPWLHEGYCGKDHSGRAGALL
jgi:hypothetical protein